MSGWIKIEKSLRDDPRVLRIARQLGNACVTHERFNNSALVTLVVGCLVQLWCYADTHIREDDTLDLGADDVDEIVGLQGFCDLMPEDWLHVIDSEHVKLPGFLAHNGTEARKKALTQKRVARHRASVTPERSKEKRACNAQALPDQDQTKTRPRPKEEGARERALAVPGLDLKAWEEWQTYRAERKPAIKATSLVAAAGELAAFGDQQATVVRHSVANGYQGLFAPKTSGAGFNGKHPEDTGWRPPEAKR